MFLIILWSVYCDPTWHHIAAANLLIGCSRSCSRFGLFELSLVLRFHCKALPFRQAAPRAASCIQNGVLLPGWLWTQLDGLADVLPLTPTSFLLNWYSRPLRCALYWVLLTWNTKVNLAPGKTDLSAWQPDHWGQLLFFPGLGTPLTIGIPEYVIAVNTAVTCVSVTYPLRFSLSGQRHHRKMR